MSLQPLGILFDLLTRFFNVVRFIGVVAVAMTPFAAWVLYCIGESGQLFQGSAGMKTLWRKELTAEGSVFAAAGRVGGREIVKGQLTLRHVNLATIDPRLAPVDARQRDEMRALFDWLRARPATDAAQSG